MPKKKIVEEVFKAPSTVLDKAVRAVERGEKKIQKKKTFRRAKEFMTALGPGLTTGAADDDPSGIATYSQVGARVGFQFLWLSLFTFPFMSIVQEMCARIGMVTGQGLAANIRRHYARPVLYSVAVLLFIANTFNIAADLGAMSAATRLLLPQIPSGLLITLFAIFIVALQIFTSYKSYARILKYMTFALFSYVLTAFAVHLNWADALRHAVVPSFNFTFDEVFLLSAFLGTTISPYLFFWQTAQEVEEEILKGRVTIASRKVLTDAQELRSMRQDVWSGMFFSNLVNFFIMATCAATLFANGITTIVSADEAAMALRPFAGDLTYFFFALGIIGTGLLAVPVLAGSSAYVLAESLRWKEGLYLKLRQARAFYGVIIVSVFIGLIGNFFHIDPIKALIYSAILNGVISPIILFFIIRLSSNKKVMSAHTNKPLITMGGWFIMVIMTLASIGAILSFFY